MIYSYKMGSKSAKVLGVNLGVSLIKHRNSKFHGLPRHTVINWGCSALPPHIGTARVLNPPARVALATNKRSLFLYNDGCLDPARIPWWTTIKVEAAQRLAAKPGFIVGRELLAGQGGEGIVLFTNVHKLLANDEVKLYTEYVPKKEEFRVHVFQGRIVDVQRKARRLDLPDDQVDYKIRNLANGFIFARADINPPEDVLMQGLKIMDNLGLDFGAVDVIWNERREKAYVLEVNTAPGLQGSTLDIYVNEFKELLG